METFPLLQGYSSIITRNNDKTSLFIPVRQGRMLHGGGPGYFATLESVLSAAPHPNLLILWYEDMKRDEKKMVTLIADHVGCKLNNTQVCS